MGTAEWFIIVLVCVVSIVGGIITGIYGRKHRNNKSGHGFWGVIFAISALFNAFDDKKRK